MCIRDRGGSVIDTAKAIAAGVPYEGDFWDFYIGKAKVKKALKVGVVLTIPAVSYTHLILVLTHLLPLFRNYPFTLSTVGAT